jgi:transposase
MCAADELAVWTAALNLPGCEVVDYQDDAGQGERRLSVVPTQAVGLCPGCGRACQSFHQKRWLERVVDLPLGGRPVALKVRVFQYQCAPCGRVWTADSPIVAPGTWATCRLVERAAELVRRADVAGAAAFFGLPEKTLERWYYDYVARQRDATPAVAKPIRAIGIDELSLKKNTASSSP